MKQSATVFVAFVSLIILSGMTTVAATTNVGMLRVASFQCPREVPPGGTFSASLDVEYAIQGLPDVATIRGAVYPGSINSTTALWESDPISISNGGDEVWNLTLTAPTSGSTFNLTAYALYLDNGTWSYFSNPENGPGVSQAVIKLGTNANLEVDVGAPGVTVTMDDVTEQTTGTGSVSFNAKVGTTPLVSVPSQLELANSTRIIFSQWSDGVTQPQRQVLVDGDIVLSVTYRVQYLLIVNAGSTTEQWYDQGSNATITAPTSPPAPWPLNIFGVTQSFRAWSGDAQSTSPQLNITMDSPKTITADYSVDYQPLAIPGIFVLGIVTAAISLVLLRRRASPEQESIVETPTEEPVAQSSLTTTCPNCGQETEPEWAHCIKCGTKLAEGNPQGHVQN